jgi:hypothetical protein
MQIGRWFLGNVILWIILNFVQISKHCGTTISKDHLLGSSRTLLFPKKGRRANENMLSKWFLCSLAPSFESMIESIESPLFCLSLSYLFLPLFSVRWGKQKIITVTVSLDWWQKVFMDISVLPGVVTPPVTPALRRLRQEDGEETGLHSEALSQNTRTCAYAHTHRISVFMLLFVRE